MPKKLFLVTLFVVGCFGSFLHAQSSLSPSTPAEKYAKFLSATANYGHIWKHRKSLTGLPDAYPKGIELNIGWQTNGRKAWHQMHNFPRWGFQVLYYNLDNPSVYGHSLHITPYIDLFFLKRAKHELYVKMGTGLGIYPVHYQKDNNPENVLVSQTFSATGLFSINYRFLISSHWSTLLAFNFNHSSNGSMKQPNFGINIPAIGAGIHYTFHPERLHFIRQELPEVKKSWNFNANLSFSFRQSPAEPLNDVYYPAYTLTTYVSKTLSRKSIVVAGLDACYDESIKYTIREDSNYIAGKYPIFRYAATLGYEFVLTPKTHIMMQNAFYLYDPYKIDVPVYQRFGFKFMPIKNMYLGYFLKTHFGKADFWEFAVGVRL